MLPTNQKAILGLYSNSFLIYFNGEDDEYNSTETTKSQHLYITSDEVIKEDNWCLHTMGEASINPQRIIKATHSNLESIQEWWNKIIATTDPSLNLPQPSHSFITKYIEEYNKGNTITDIIVEYDQFIPNNKINLNGGYHTDIKINSKDNTITIKKIKDSWTAEEMFLNMQYYMEYCRSDGYITPQDWLENHKHF